MTRNAMPDDRQLALAPLDEKIDHVRGSPAGHLIIEYAITSARTRVRRSTRSSKPNASSAGTCGSRSGISR
jgi:hypothetical protein